MDQLSEIPHSEAAETDGQPSEELRNDPGLAEEAERRETLGAIFDAFNSHGRIPLESVFEKHPEAARDKPLMMEAITKLGTYLLQYASAGLRGDPEFIIHALHRGPFAGTNPLRYAMEPATGNVDVILTAIRLGEEHGLRFSLQYASPEIRGNRDLVLEALKRNQATKEDIAPELARNDPEIANLVMEMERAELEEMAQQFGVSVEELLRDLNEG